MSVPRFLLASFALFVSAYASGDLVLLHTPDSVQFKGSEEIDQSLLKEIFSASLGYTPKQRAKWSGMTIVNPFGLPEALVGVAVEGVDNLGTIKGLRFPLNSDEVEETTWQALSGRLEERDNENNLVRMYLADGVDALGQSALGELKPNPIDKLSLKALSIDNAEDKKFLEEVQLLYAIAKKVPTAISSDGKPDVYWLVVSGLKPVFDAHGNDSPAAREALSLLNDAVSSVSKAFVDVYKKQVLIAIFTNDASQVRHARSTDRIKRQAEAVPKDENNKEFVPTSRPEEPTTPRPPLKAENLNLADKVDPDFPVMFNIFLWFTVFFIFSLIAICIAIADMDPGRDSIIYRMTSNRMKKDN